MISCPAVAPEELINTHKAQREEKHNYCQLLVRERCGLSILHHPAIAETL